MRSGQGEQRNTSDKQSYARTHTHVRARARARAHTHTPTQPHTQVVIFGVPYTPDFYFKDSLSTLLTVLFSLCPWDLLVKGFTDLGSATVAEDDPGG